MTILGNSLCRAIHSTPLAGCFLFFPTASALQRQPSKRSNWRVTAQFMSSTLPTPIPAPCRRAGGDDDFSGNACEGYALLFRQVSELDNGEGRTTLSDLRSTSWEEGAAKRYVFKSAELSQ